MKFNLLNTMTILIILFFSYIVYAQSGGREADSDGGIFAIANPGKQGRVITVGGRLSPARKISHSTAVSGFIQTILVELGDPVKPGQPLIQITRDVIGETFLPVVLESRIKGIVSDIHVFEKQEVNSGIQAITILDNSSFLLKTSVSDRDARAIGELGSIQVNGKTPEGNMFPGRIKQISQEPDYTTGLFSLTMEFPNIKGLYLGMVLFVDLEATKGEGIIIEEAAVFVEEGLSYVWIIDNENKLTQREIVRGDGKKIETIIIEGLNPGERYVREISGNEKEGLDFRDLIQADMNDNSSEGKD